MVALFLVLLSSSGRPWGEDFEAYYRAAERMAAGASPYTAAQISGPVDAVCPGCYLYPPFLAQVLVPFTWLPYEVAMAAWFALMYVGAYLATWIAGSIGGAQPSLERVLWTLAAVAFFFPVFQSNWLGNISSLIALLAILVAIGRATAGVGGSVGILVKLAPMAWWPAVFAAGRRSGLALVGSFLLLFGVSFVLAPDAWLEFPTVLRNLLVGSGDVHWNLSWSVLAREAQLGTVAEMALRLSSVALAIAALATSAWVARYPGGLPAAVALATVTMLLLPDTLWYHYLAVLLPLAAMAWPRGAGAVRAALVLALAAVSVAGVVFSPLATLVGSGSVVAMSAWVLLPSHSGSPDPRVDNQRVAG